MVSRGLSHSRRPTEAEQKATHKSRADVIELPRMNSIPLSVAEPAFEGKDEGGKRRKKEKEE